MKNWMQEEIDKFAEQILEKIKDGFLFGEKIDLDNINQVIVATYWAGEIKGREEKINGLELL